LGQSVPFYDDFDPIVHIGDDPDLQDVGDAIDEEMTGHSVIDHIIFLKIHQYGRLDLSDIFSPPIGEAIQE
jgi:hypothetical protein